MPQCTGLDQVRRPFILTPESWILNSAHAKRSAAWASPEKIHPPVENFSTGGKNPSTGGKPSPRAAFTLVELLASLAAVALLAAILAGAFPAALAASRSAACRSNLRQLVAANLAYASDHGRYVPAAADVEGPNTLRWHCTRSGSSFDGTQGPLAPYLGGGGASAAVRRCPAFRPDAPGFEASCGGYGYNAHGVGSEIAIPNGAGTRLGMRPAALLRPSLTLMFADAAFLQGSGKTAKLVEYSFAEPARFPSGGVPWPTIHFRHRGRANVAWCDGRVSSESLDRAAPRFAAHSLGWFGPDDNRFFDPF